MKKRKQRNIIIIVLLAVMIGLMIIIIKNKNNSTLKQIFTVNDTETITKIYLADKTGNKLTIKKITDSVWTLNDSDTANYSMVNMLLTTLKDMRIREPIPKPAHKNIMTAIATQRTEVQIYQERYAIDFWFIHLFKKERLTKTIYVGTETQDNMGTYMLLKGTNNPYVLYIPHFRGYLVTRFLPYIDLWKSHNVFRYKPQDIASLKIELPNREYESFELYQKDSTFNFKILKTGEDLKDFDTMKVAALLSSFVELNYESLAKNITNMERDTVFAYQPLFKITVKDMKGKSRCLRTYAKLYNPDTWVLESDKDNFYEIMDNDRMYAIADGIKDTLILQFFVMDNILNPASYYFNK